MASNDGARLAVFGLTFRQHDNRQMQQILRTYGRLPSNPGNRATLFTSLFDLSTDLGDNEVQGITNWLQNGGVPVDFPAPRPATPSPVPSDDMDVYGGEGVDPGDEGEGEWQEYNPADFENGDIEVADAYPAVGYEMGFENGQELPDHDERFEQPGEPFEDAVHLGNIAQGRDVLHDFDDDLDDLGNTAKGAKRPENECSICMEVMESTDKFVPSKVTTTCNHDHDMRTCFNCLKRQLTSNIESGSLAYLNCPFCPEKLSAEEVKRYATSEAFARYQYLVMVANPDIVMCLGPGCGSGQLHPDTSNPKMICNTCSFASCAHHKLPWHEGETCEEFDCGDTQIDRLEQAEATAKLLAKDESKICPSCKQGVTKQEGCDHLSCRCGEAWCFVCLASWDNIMRIGNEAHAPTCIYHPRKLQKSKAQQAAGQSQMTETLLGAPASEALLKARGARNERNRVEIRPKAAEAAEKRMKAMRETENGKEKEDESMTKKKRVKLLPAWEER